MYKLIEKLEALIEKWENTPYTGDLTKAATSVCAKELREVIGSSDAKLQQGYFDFNNDPF